MCHYNREVKLFFNLKIYNDETQVFLYPGYSLDNISVDVRSESNDQSAKCEAGGRVYHHYPTNRLKSGL